MASESDVRVLSKGLGEDCKGVLTCNSSIVPSLLIMHNHQPSNPFSGTCEDLLFCLYKFHFICRKFFLQLVNRTYVFTLQNSSWHQISRKFVLIFLRTGLFNSLHHSTIYLFNVSLVCKLWKCSQQKKVKQTKISTLMEVVFQ